NALRFCQIPNDFGKMTGGQGVFMGGLGSGDWTRDDTKSTVEKSLGVAMKDFRGRIFPGAAGTLGWTGASGNKSSVGYFVTWGDVPILTLHYRWRDSEDVRIPVRL